MDKLINPQNIDNKAPTTSVLNQIGYGVGQVSGQIFRDTPSLLLLFFLTNTLGINPALAGAAIFFPKLFWGVICDFGVGMTSDRLSRKLPRRMWLLAGAILSPIALILLFRVPQGGEVLRAGYVAVVFSFYMLVFAIFTVPYLAISVDMSGNARERTALMAWRLVFTAVGVLIGDSLAPMLLQRLGGRQDAYQHVSLLLAGVCCIALLITFFSATRKTRPTAPRAPPRLGDMIAALKDRKLSALMLPVFVQLIGLGMSYASFAYFLTYNAGRHDALVQLGVIILISSFSVMAAQPVWVMLAKTYGKKNIYVFSSLTNALIQIIWGLSANLPVELGYIYGIVFGFMNSGFQLMSLSILSDIIADDEYVTGPSRAGLLSAFWSITDKVAFALGGTLVTGLILAFFGFQAQSAAVGGGQPASALTGIVLAYAFIPAALNSLAALLYAILG